MWTMTMSDNHTVDEAEHVLRHTSDAGLIRTFAALTHRLHVADRERTAAAPIIRGQRDRVELEILRRMAGHARVTASEEGVRAASEAAQNGGGTTTHAHTHESERGADGSAAGAKPLS
jgi:hypothetical protein